MFHAEGTACANGAPTKEGGGGCSGDWKKSTLTEVKRGRAGGRGVGLKRLCCLGIT